MYVCVCVCALEMKNRIWGYKFQGERYVYQPKSNKMMETS